MNTITLRVANTEPFIGTSGIAIIGKNGFETTIGQVNPLVTNAYVVGANLVFSVDDLNMLYDDNFDCHLLEARSNAELSTLVSSIPDNLATFTINSKSTSSTSGKLAGTVGFEPTLSTITSNITSFDISANTISMSFSSSDTANQIKQNLLPTPFYVGLGQIINTQVSKNIYYISGGFRTVSNTHSTTGLSGTANLVINTVPAKKGLIKTFINQSYTPTNSLEYSFQAGNDYITHNIANTYIQIKTEVEDYTVPHIEEQDSIFIYDNEQYITVNNISYSSTSSGYNTALTAANFFKVEFDEGLTSNVSSALAVNSTEDLIADVASVDPGTSITIEYDDAVYPQGYTLFSERIYNMAPFSWDLFKSIDIVDNKLEVPTVAGIYIFKIASVNDLNRTSPPVTKSVNLDSLPLGQVENFTLTEVLFRDRTKGVMSRISGVFDHIEGRNVREYDVSYRVNLVAGTEPHPSGITDFNSFKIDKTGIGSDGKVRFTIDNIDLGDAGNTYEIEVIVTPLNGLNKGIYNSKKLELEGKSDRPLPLTSFDVYQTDSTIVFEVDYPLDNQENLSELDILHTEIRLRSPIVPIDTEDELDFAFVNGDVLILIPHPLTRAEISADKVGEGSFTFTAKTVDTSGNKSGSARGKNVTIDLPSTIIPIAAWNEARPNANVIVGSFNNNYSTNYYVGVTESDNGGFVYDVDPVTSAVLGVDTPSTSVEDANASATGFTWSINANGAISADDLVITNAHASYISPIRDLGSVIKGSLAVTSTVDTQLTKTWLDMSEELIVGVAEEPPSANVLVDEDFEIGTVVGYNNSSFSFSFSNTHATVIDNSPYTRVFAIINPGQEVVGEVEPREDISNVFSYALIAGAINAHAVEISNVYYANGTAVVNGNAAVSSALSNITAAGSSYKLVDLYQFIDEEAERDYTPELDITKNVFVRFSTANVFSEAADDSLKPHGNVVTSSFDSTSLDGNWTQQYFGLRRFRYFQVRVDVDIKDYGESANAYLDQLYYQVSSPRKNFSTTVTSTSNIEGNIFVDYSSVGFYDSPSVFCQVLDDSPFIAKTNSLTSEGCNVRIIDTTTGQIVSNTGIEILVSASGA